MVDGASEVGRYVFAVFVGLNNVSALLGAEVDVGPVPALELGEDQL